ncbi:MAG: hypothetical protein EOP48_31825 [Sphingobacteriales bacterium]|nr:MAG: hypothetical protein EOP48_31825 [Sphingobacteriales bacterium]
MGGVASFKWRSLKISANAVVHRFSQALQKSDKPYDLYGIEGKEWGNASIDYSWTHKNKHLFGELAIDRIGNKAWLSGLMISLDPKVDAALLYRNIQPGYQTLWGNAFTENVLPVNEKGLYMGLSVRPVNNWRLDAYLDIYQFPWLKYGIDAPSIGKDFLLQATYQPNKQTALYVRYKAEDKAKNNSTNDVLHQLTAFPKESFRFHLVYKLSAAFTLKSRIELLEYAKDQKAYEEGFLMYLQGEYSMTARWKGNMRLQFFETGGYNSRVYAYESDVLYGYSIPSFFDKGFRYYLNINFDLSKKWSVWGRWAQTLYKEKKTIGSGLDLINGNSRAEYKLQTMFLF